MSSAYRSLHINTSRQVMAFKTLPMPDHFPDYPDHFQMAAYFDEFADHFGLREKISFRTEVVKVEPADGGWAVTTKGAGGDEHTERYRAVMVANGHHWDPRWPEPAFPGSEEFEGEQMHAHHYREPDVLRGKRVLVLGLGNSATDIAVESSRIAEKTFLAVRRGAYVLPKYMNGKPIDEAAPPTGLYLPLSVQRFFAMKGLEIAAGDMTAYGLPKPDHKLFEAHPTVSSELLPRLGHGDITVKPNIDRFAGGRTVRFVDGSEEEIDLVVYCTGYKISFPFFDSKVLRGAGQPAAALPAGRLGRAPRALFHRSDPAAGADHAAGRGAVRMGRRPARRPGDATAGGGDEEGDRARGTEAGETLRCL